MLALCQVWQQLLADGTLQIAKFDGGFFMMISLMGLN